jgi:hypothetical protein
MSPVEALKLVKVRAEKFCLSRMVPSDKLPRAGQAASIPGVRANYAIHAQVKLLTPNAPGITCGPTVSIQLAPDTPMYEVKLQLQVSVHQLTPQICTCNAVHLKRRRSTDLP